MKNRQNAGVRTLQKGMAWLLAAVLLIAMMPLAGFAAAQAASYPTSGECGDSARWSFNTKTGALTISGSGAMWDWEDPADEEAEYIAPWIDYYYDSIKSISINNGITEIGDYTFAYCESAASVSIPNSVKTIGEGAFIDCISLKNITIPNSTATVYELAFAFCESLKNISVPASVTALGSSAFAGCLAADRIQIASGNTKYKSVDGVVFSKDGSTLLIYPSGKKDHVYNVPAGTAKIGEMAFLYNPSIRAISIPDSTATMAFHAIACNEKLLRIYIPAEMERIEGTVVDECPLFTDVYFEGSFARRNQMFISATNTQLFNAEWHFNAGPEAFLTAMFEDVGKKAFYFQPVNWAARTGVTTGTSDVTFGPENICTRGQAVTFLWRASGSEIVTGVQNPFNDVKKGDYYYNAVLWAIKNNVTKGMTEDTFGPTGKCTRGQIVTFLWRAENEPEASTSVSFKDTDEKAFYFKAVQWAVEHNVTAGTSELTFSPASFCTRGQIVTFLYRTQKKYTVTFDVNGGNGGRDPDSKQLCNGEAYGQMPSAWKEGYDFADWYTEPDGGTLVSDTTIVNLTEDQTLYAHWTGRSFSLNFNPNGGKVELDYKSVKNGETYGTLPAAEREGYVFDGWYTSPTGGTLITEDTIVNLRDIQTLYAHWSLTEIITDSWEQIIESVNDGTYKEKYKIGERKMLDLGEEGIVEMQIAAFDTDELADGSGKAAITWISKQLLGAGHQMNPQLAADQADPSLYQAGTGSIGGWKQSEMRKWLQSDFKELIPSDVRDVIKPVVKYSSSYDTAGNWIKNEETADDIWIPSFREMGGTGEYAETEGPVYSGLLADNNFLKKYKNGDTKYSAWYLRSADGWRNDCFEGVIVEGMFSGGFSASYTSTVAGSAIGFCM